MDAYQVISQYYDLEHDDFQDDIDFLLQLVQEGPVLEVGVGTGRVAAALLEAGFEVWGIDPSQNMLQLAKARLARYTGIHLVCTTAGDLHLDQRFPVVLLPLNTVWHLPDSDAQLHALTALRRHCQDRALLVVDCSNPLSMADRGADGEVRERFTRDTEQGTVRAVAASWDDPAEQVLTISLLYDTTSTGGLVRRSTTELQLRYLFRFELELLLKLAGFSLLHLYGSYDLEPYQADSPNLIALALAI